MATDIDLSTCEVTEARMVLRKFDGEVADHPEWLSENGGVTVEGQSALAEVVVVENDVIVDRWTRAEERDAPE